jgi:hypothetical protein
MKAKIRVKCSNWKECTYGSSESLPLECRGYTCTSMLGREEPATELGVKIRCDAISWFNLLPAYYVDAREAPDAGA